MGKIDLNKKEKFSIKKLRKERPSWTWKSFRPAFGAINYEGERGGEKVWLYFLRNRSWDFGTWRVQNLKEAKFPPEDYEDWTRKQNEI